MKLSVTKRFHGSACISLGLGRNEHKQLVVEFHVEPWHDILDVKNACLACSDSVFLFSSCNSGKLPPAERFTFDEKLLDHGPENASSDHLVINNLTQPQLEEE